MIAFLVSTLKVTPYGIFKSWPLARICIETPNFEETHGLFAGKHKLRNGTPEGKKRGPFYPLFTNI